MADQEPLTERDSEALQELFVSVTGEEVITDRQEQETDRKILRNSDS